MSKWTKIATVVLGGFLGLFLVLWVSSERVRYAASAAVDHVRLMASRVSVQSLIDAPDTPTELRAKLETVLRARRFASEELALPDNASYKHYIDVGRPEVGWNVFAAPELSLKPLEWCFPVAGCVVYRGYSSESDAWAFAADLREQGNDVYVARFTAYSTLGWFEDSLLSTFMDRPAESIVGIIFHELAHQQLYVAGDSDFNEAFAMTVEHEGLRRWLRSEDEAEALDRIRDGWDRSDQRTRLMLHTRGALGELYASSLGPMEMRERKQTLLNEVRQSLCTLDGDCASEESARAREKRPLNNATLAAVATYSDLAPEFEKLLAREGGDLARFYEQVAVIANLPANERAERLTKFNQ
jgi:predicted aminopeptidase